MEMAAEWEKVLADYRAPDKEARGWALIRAEGIRLDDQADRHCRPSECRETERCRIRAVRRCQGAHGQRRERRVCCNRKDPPHEIARGGSVSGAELAGD